MTEPKLDITPAVTVHNLLEAYPELEEVLIGIAPPFKKLKNPLLRRSVAKVATLKHVSAVGRVPLDQLLSALRSAVGQPPIGRSYADEIYFLPQPDWFSPEKIAATIDEGAIADEDRMTLVTVANAAKAASPGEIIELITTFLPAPGIDVMKKKGYAAWTKRGEGNTIHTYFLS